MAPSWLHKKRSPIVMAGSRSISGGDDNNKDLLTAVNSDSNDSTGSYEGPLLNDGYSEESWRIAEYLTTLKRPDGMSKDEFKKLKRQALIYAVLEYRTAQKNIPMRVIVDSDEDRVDIFRELHDKAGHRGIESTYHKIATRYVWESCYQDTKLYVISYSECQFRDS